MIKFFRIIRQKLLSEGKICKYLSYAIGEIILVVIGILIALQINLWNEQRKERVKECAYFESLTSDLQNQIATIESRMNFESEVIQNHQDDPLRKLKLLNEIKYRYRISGVHLSIMEILKNESEDLIKLPEGELKECDASNQMSDRFKGL